MATLSRGGCGGWEPRARILERRARAWKLSVAGRTQREIAAELGVSQPAVTKILARAAADLNADLRQHTQVHVMRQLSQLDELYEEQRAAWHRSKGEKTRR